VRLLLDTHALLWWLSGDPRLGPAATALVADPLNEVLASAASLWEIAVKTRIGKLEADVAEIAAAMRDQGFRLLDIAIPHLAALQTLPAHHRDPFDHLLIATALVEGATFLTADRHAAAYPVRILSASS
jgi:PIN domain nuclease of toxin-antitoxin system